MGKIIAVGGGSMPKGQTLAIDKEVVALTGKKKPLALFIPTASGDPEQYIADFHAHYSKKLGCRTSDLCVAEKRPPLRVIKEKIQKADIIYVGGGNTMKMMKRWKLLGIDKLLRKAWKQNKVLTGTSAGGICWFRYGSSDSRLFYDPQDKSLIRVKALDLLPLTFSPHMIQEKHRKKGIAAIMERTPGVAIAVDDWAALEIVDDTYRIIASRKGSGASKVYKSKGQIVWHRLEASKDFKPLAPLLAKP